MIIIDEPYVSPYLVDVILKSQYEILDTPNARKLIQKDGLNWIDTNSAIEKIKAYPDTRIYSNSENALSWLDEHLPQHRLSTQIPILKDKNKFRSYLKSIYPEFFFETVLLEDIKSLKIDRLPMPFVIKPSIGFFSIGVHIIKSKTDWAEAKEALQMDKLKSMFPANVLDTSTFLIEEYIEGEEYAIDYYYDGEGNAVVLNVLHHVFSSGTDTSDRVYRTSKETITTHAHRLEEFLTTVGQGLELRNFPAHAEVRIEDSGHIVPIEINPLRFGGWCTTGDQLGISLGFNSYDCFFQNEKPNWDAIFKGKEDKTYSIIILNNNSGIDPNDIKRFDYDKLSLDVENTLLIRKLDINHYPVFGFVFAEHSPSRLDELTELLVSDLKSYIELKE